MGASDVALEYFKVTPLGLQSYFQLKPLRGAFHAAKLESPFNDAFRLCIIALCEAKLLWSICSILTNSHIQHEVGIVSHSVGGIHASAYFYCRVARACPSDWLLIWTLAPTPDLYLERSYTCIMRPAGIGASS